MPRFVIDLGDMEMSNAAAEALNAELQKVALSHVADLRMEKPLAIRFPRPFPWGIIIGPEFDDVLRSQKRLESAFQELR
ncbi:hypothetical protein AIOL_004220 [Candidatus Rhodobacter oscarellae]|uniref:Uncharacterized protein n=1 Tax=Candidatus Rhodobacter oscarellae TaxID=1675527 RepID=A0A0J9EC23_9RHOB|nr:hypothetical protein [Candidatus Rhodobacter lobularis]KMW59239.1 hypothetical protein AIOL_004220 [Candidatus Rhodobacter lobularis]